MKITFLTTQSSYWGGSEVLWIRVAELAIANGHEVQIVVYDQKDGLHPELKRIKKKVQSMVLMKNYYLSSSFIRRVCNAFHNVIFKANLKFVTKFNADTIVISQANNFDAAFHPVIYPFLLNYKRPFYLISQFNVEHGVLTAADITKASAIFNKAKSLFFVSRRNKETSERQLAQKIGNAICIDNPLNLQDPTYIPYPLKEVINFASVARFDVKYKGQDIILQTLSAPEWRERDWVLNFYGSGPDEAYLKKLTAYYHLENKVIFKGQVSDIKDIWANNHALLMPSIAEGKPLALEEAMVCGRIGIVSDVAGNSELIDHDVNGYLSSSFFPKPFAKTLEKAWNERDTWEHKGKKAHEKMMTTLDFHPEETILKRIAIS